MVENHAVASYQILPVQAIGSIKFFTNLIANLWSRESRPIEFQPNDRESTDLSTEESLLRTIERNLSSTRTSSKKSLQADQKPEDLNGILSKTQAIVNNEDDMEAEKEKCKKGMKKIEDNNLKLDDLHEHIKNIRAETEEIRRENAKMFHIYKESFILSFVLN